MAVSPGAVFMAVSPGAVFMPMLPDAVLSFCSLSPCFLSACRPLAHVDRSAPLGRKRSSALGVVSMIETWSTEGMVKRVGGRC